MSLFSTDYKGVLISMQLATRNYTLKAESAEDAAAWVKGEHVPESVVDLSH